MDNPIKVDLEIKKINDSLRLCKKVEETLATPGWKEVIEPLIDKMIMDVVGSKINGEWYGGLLDRARKEEKREYYIGYKQFGIDLHRRIMAYVNTIKINEEKVHDLIKNKDDVRYKLPLVDDTRYAPEG